MTPHDEVLAQLYAAGWAEQRTATHPRPPADDRSVVLRRGVAWLQVNIAEHTVTLGPRSATGGGRPDDGIDILTAPIDIAHPPGGPDIADLTEAYGAAGLLDPTCIGPTGDDAVAMLTFWLAQVKALFAAAGTSRRSAAKLDTALRRATSYDTRLLMSAMSNRVPLPEPVPSAAAIGIALVGWRDTAVEDAHVDQPAVTDIVMAKLNIAATRIVRDHVTHAGVDWRGIRTKMLDPGRALPDGRVVADLFGPSWPRIRHDVDRRLRAVENACRPLGSQALPLLSLVGATTTTRQWWGTGRWPALCRSVLRRRSAAGVGLPDGFDGTWDQLRNQLADRPDHLDDHVLQWCLGTVDSRSGPLVGVGREPGPTLLTVAVGTA